MEIVVAELGETADEDQIYRLTYDGSVGDESGFVAMGGQAEAISNSLRASHREGLQLGEAIRVALRSLEAGHQQGGHATESLRTDQLEVAVLDRNRPRRAFRRIAGAALERLLGEARPRRARRDRWGSRCRRKLCWRG